MGRLQCCSLWGSWHQGGTSRRAAGRHTGRLLCNQVAFLLALALPPGAAAWTAASTAPATGWPFRGVPVTATVAVWPVEQVRMRLRMPSSISRLNRSRRVYMGQNERTRMSRLATRLCQ